MDKDRNKTTADKKASGPARRCKRPDTCIHLRSLRQQNINPSTQVLYRGPNFQAHRSDEDIFFDCLSTSDTDIPREGHKGKNFDNLTSQPSNQTNAKPIFTNPINISCKSTCSGQASNTSKYDDPEVVRAVLIRAENATQMLLRHFERNRGDSKCHCNATLEITARLLTDPKESTPKCLQGRPVTVQMPLKFDPCSGQMITTGPSRPVAKSGTSVCSKYTSKGRDPCQQPFVNLREASDVEDNILIKGSCSFAKDYSCPAYQTPLVPVPVPIPAPPPEPVPVPSSKVEPVRQIIPVPIVVPPPVDVPPPDVPPPDVPPPVEPPSYVPPPVLPPEPIPEPEQPLKKADESIYRGSVTPLLEESPEPSKTEGEAKKYFLALPQHKEFSNCSPCRFEPSPLMDEDGNVFCPGNCGCCQCPWKRRSLDENRERVNVKVCRCVQRGTIFTNFDERETCSQTSYFDFCPCREKAEAKFLELYNCEMWSSPNITRGREVQLTEIQELKIPP